MAIDLVFRDRLVAAGELVSQKRFAELDDRHLEALSLYDPAGAAIARQQRDAALAAKALPVPPPPAPPRPASPYVTLATLEKSFDALLDGLREGVGGRLEPLERAVDELRTTVAATQAAVAAVRGELLDRREQQVVAREQQQARAEITATKALIDLTHCAPWLPSRTYAPGDLVRRGDGLWQCVLPHAPDGQGFNVTAWQLLDEAS